MRRRASRIEYSLPRLQDNGAVETIAGQQLLGRGLAEGFEDPGGQGGDVL